MFDLLAQFFANRFKELAGRGIKNPDCRPVEVFLKVLARFGSFRIGQIKSF